MIWLTVLFIIVIVLLYIESKRIIITKHYSHIPGPKGYPLIGNVFSITNNKIEDLLGIFDKLNPYPVTKVHCVGHMAIFIAEPVAAQQVLGSPAFLDRPVMFDFFKLQHGILTARCKHFFNLESLRNFFSRFSIQLKNV